MNKRNYVLINGHDSRGIKGLLIQELPPIVKPQMRISEEEVDGHDGDFITELGFSAYDKEMIIGLYGDYDIDAVIEFFSMSGEITFSNELSKVYEFKIYDQIDFERLARFRTATITLHCQPFKFSSVDKEFIPKWSLLDFKSGYTQTKNGVTVSTMDGSLQISGTATKDSEFFVPIVPMELETGKYTIKTSVIGAVNGLARICKNVPIDAQSLGGYFSLGNNHSATLTDEVTFYWLWIYVPGGATENGSVSVALDISSVTMENYGNIIARPTFIMTGTGTVELFINGKEVLAFVFPSGGKLTISGSAMEAYVGSVLYNRYVQGDYSDLVFQKGTNVVSWNGNITSMTILNKSRWI